MVVDGAALWVVFGLVLVGLFGDVFNFEEGFEGGGACWRGRCGGDLKRMCASLLTRVAVIGAPLLQY